MSWLISRALMEAYENSRSSQEQEAEFSADTCSGGEPFAQLNVMPTQHPFWHKDKTMDCWNPSQFGLTCAVLTDARGAELLTWFLAAFPAKILAPAGKERESGARDLASGKKWRASFAKFDLDTSSWKTPQSLLLGGLEQFSETWPRWGLMLDGECWALDTLERPMLGNESGYWPTPTTVGRSGGAALCKWGGSHARAKLRTMVTEKELNGPLDPAFPSWLMGWPTGWSNLTPLATDKFREWRRQHGACSEASE